MKALKFTIVFAVLLGSGIFAMAQSNYSEYMEYAVIFLDEGNCEKAEMNYDVYKSLSGKSSALIEQKLSECKDSLGVSSGIKRVQLNFNDYEVLPSDLDGKYAYYEAKTACNNLTAFGKSDWYLPDKSELAGLYKHKNEIGGFADGWYWSSSPQGYDGSISRQYFSNGIQDSTKYGSFLVRCIRKVNK